jgi:long-subunit fatty acid transport protein
MKSPRIITTALFVFIAMSLNAQVFLGGGLGFNTAGGSVDDGSSTTDKPSTFNFNISPMVGKFASEKLAYGLALNFVTGRTESAGTPVTINTSNTYGFTPFLRYYAVKMNKFSVFGQANAGISFSNSKSKTGGVTIDGPKTSMLYLNIYPALSYEISERLSLEAGINILNFGLNYTTVKTGNTTDKTTNFGFGAGLNNIVKLGDITIGAIYKF